ncbi:MAG: HAMP domain-containing sensor histidine kinase [Nitrospirales bacterium]
MKPFETFDPPNLAEASFKTEQAQLSTAHSLENLMKLPDPPSAPLHSKGNAPSPTQDDSLRIALLGCNQRSHLTRSLLEHIPGVEIVGITDPRHWEQKGIQQHEIRCGCYPCPETLLKKTSPHILLNFTNEAAPVPLANQGCTPDMEIPGQHTTTLLEKFIQDKSVLDQQMTQIEKMTSIGTLASGIIHDINNPMYVILGFAENLLEEKDLMAVQEQATEVLQAARRIITICKDLNFYAHQQTPKECVTVILTQQLEEAMKVAKFATGLENMTVVRAYSANPTILARSEEIVQIFVNLIINALQAMDGHGILTLGASCTDQRAIISIGDTGTGIPPGIMDKVFEPFYTTKPPGKGTGLGLHSVQSLVKKLGGEIQVQSTVGKGTTFQLHFPLPSTPNVGQPA